MTFSNLNPLLILRTVIKNRYLLGQLIRRDVALRYRGAMLGILWEFINPLIMLTIFSFVFGRIFPPRWPEHPEGLPFWLIIYSGLIVFNMFAEAVSRSPSSVREYPSFVKKIVFPVTILPVVPLGVAIVHGVLSMSVLAAALAWKGNLSAGILLFPLLLSPLMLLILGLSWFLAAWGVFIKDMTQIVPVLIQISLFLSPVFYPVSSVPDSLRIFYKYNPISAVIEACRAVVIGDTIPWYNWNLALGVGMIAAIFGHAFFLHSREEFADAL